MTPAMSAYEITIYCSMCPETHKATIDLPDGWSGTYNGVDDELGLCPKHAAIQAFKDAQCPGCVGGWGDCNLWRDFAYSPPRHNAHPLTEDDFKLLRLGACPRRINGTIGVHSTPGARPYIDDIDLSAPSVAGGRALADAIIDYQNTYEKR
jgi:hypothetical protein